MTRFARRELDEFREREVEERAVTPEEQARIDREMEKVERRQQQRRERKGPAG